MGYSIWDLFSDSLKGTRTLQKDEDNKEYEEYDLDKFISNLTDSPYHEKTKYLCSFILNKLAEKEEVTLTSILRDLVENDDAENVCIIRSSNSPFDNTFSIDGILPANCKLVVTSANQAHNE